MRLSSTSEREIVLVHSYIIYLHIELCTVEGIVPSQSLVADAKLHGVLSKWCRWKKHCSKFIFFHRYPKETLDLIMSDNNIKDQQWNRFLIFLVKHPDAGAAYRESLQTTKKTRLMQLLAVNTGGAAVALPQSDKAEMQFQAIRVLSLLIKYDDQWLSTQHDLVELVKRVWCSDQYHVSMTLLIKVIGSHRHLADPRKGVLPNKLTSPAWVCLFLRSLLVPRNWQREGFFTFIHEKIASLDEQPKSERHKSV